MKTLLSLLAAVAICTTSLLGAPASADASKAMQITIENHQRLVTVKDGNGTWLFAQVLPTPNVKIVQDALGKDMSRISLQDSAGKTLWSVSRNQGIEDVDLEGGWQTSLDTVISKVSDSLDGDSSLHQQKHTSFDWGTFNHIEVIVGPADQLVSLQLTSSKHTALVSLLKDGFKVRLDRNKVLVVLTPGQTSSPDVQPVAQSSAQ